MLSIEYIIGLIAGVLAGLGLVALVVILVRKKWGGIGGKCQYDERQLLARGRAFQAGFFTVLIYEAVYAMVDAAGVRWCANVTGIVFGLMLGITVFAIVAISRDAYMSINEQPAGWMVIWCVVIGLNLFCGVRQAMRGSLIREGLLTEEWMNWMCAVMFTAILISQLAHNRKLKREELEEE